MVKYEILDICPHQTHFTSQSILGKVGLVKDEHEGGSVLTETNGILYDNYQEAQKAAKLMLKKLAKENKCDVDQLFTDFLILRRQINVN